VTERRDANRESAGRRRALAVIWAARAMRDSRIDLPPKFMLTRLNFLFGLGVLIVIGFGFAARYLVLMPLAQFAPAWTGVASGVLVLASLGLTVQLLSKTLGAMPGLATYSAAHPAGLLTFVSQGAFGCGHVALGYAGFLLLSGERPVGELQWLTAAVLYAAGAAVAVQEWRQRKKPS
jgi:hypothetical protein